MKKLLALLLVMMLAVGSLTACSPKEIFGTVKDTTVNVFNTVKKTVGGWFGIEFEDEDTDDKQNPTDKTSAELAISSLNTLYKEAEKKTTVNYTLMAKVSVNGGAEIVNVVWTTNNPAVTITPHATDASKVNVTVPAGGDADLNYTLTATVTDAAGNTLSTSFDRVVPSVNTYTTIDEYYALDVNLKENKSVIVKGIVTGVVSTANGQKYNQLYLQDESGKGGYYVYDIVSAPMDSIQVGMTVKVSGTKNVSYGVDRIEKSTVEILDTTIKTVTPVDFTEIYKNAEALTDASLVNYDGLLVTLKGVEITGQTLADGYYHFKLGDLESYVRISSSTCCIYGDDLTTFKNNHTNNKGNKADVVGVISSYDRAFYIIPVSVDAYSNFQTVTRTDAEKAQYELDGLEEFADVKADGTLDLTVAGKIYEDVVISWTSNNAAAVISADGKTVTFTIGDEAQTVTLTASAKIGDMTPVEKTFTVKVAAKSNFVVTTVTNPAVGTAYKLYLYHTNLKKDMYFTGREDGFYFATTGDPAQAVDVYLEATEGGYYLTGTVDTVKKYFNIVSSYNAEQGKIFNNVTIDTAPITVYTFDTTLNTLVTTTTCTDGEGKEVTNSFIFGTGSSKTFDTISACYKSSASSTCIAYLVSVVNVDDMTDDEKAQTQADKLVIDTDVTKDTEITLPVATVKGTTVEWSVTENATIVDGKLVITLESAAKTVVLTATVKAGTADPVVKTFTFEVPAKSNKVLTPMYTFEEGVAYKIVGQNSFGFIYFDGTDKSGRINGVADETKGVDVYVKFVDKTAGTFLLYFMDGNTVKYIDSYVNSSTKTAGFKIVTEADLSDATWSLNEQNAIVSSANGRAISTQTTSTYYNFSTYALSNIGTSGYFTSYLAAYVETDSITNEDKVDAELEGADITITEVSNDVEITLPVAKQYADDVTFSWTVDNACAVITDGKLVITIPATDVTLKVTLTVSCGEGEDKVEKTKEFTITVDAPVYTLNNVTAPAVNTAYKLYLYQGSLAKTLFFSGSVTSGGYLASTDDLYYSVDVYLEAAADVEGGYYLYYFNKAGDKKYINMYVNSSSKARFQELDAPGCVYSYSEEFHGLYTSLTTGSYTNNYYFGTNGTFDTFSPSSDYYFTGDNAGNLETTNFLCYFATVTCTHEYTAVCDDTCNACGAVRTDAADHVYTNVCDDTCDNNCGYVRQVPGHVDEAGDGTCDNCGGSMAEVENAAIEEAKTKVVIAETYANSVQFELPTAIGKVTIAWTAEGVTLNGNVVTVKLGTEAKTAKLIATYTCGATTSDPVEYALTLNKAPTLDIMEVIAPEANKAYQLYFYQANNKEGFFLDGTIGTAKYYLTGGMLDGALTAYLVEVTGGYNLKVVLDDGTEKYLNVYDVDGEHVNSLYETLEQNDTPTVYTFDKELGTLSVFVDAGTESKVGTYVMAGYGKYNNVSATLTTNSELFVLKLVEAVCYHEYSADCDASCNVCGYVREGVTEHVTYDNACDTTCVCGYVREVGDHVDVNPVDGKCDNCGLDLTETYTARIEAVKKTVSFGTKVEGGKVITLVTVGGDFNSVKVVWTYGDTVIAAGEDGTVTFTVPNVSGEVALKATYTCGTVEVKADYKFDVVKLSKVLDVEYLVENSIPFYIYAPKNDIYVIGDVVTGKKMLQSGDLAAATKLYLEKAKDAEGNVIEGQYWLYSIATDDQGVETKKYIDMTKDGASYFAVDNSADSTWAFNPENGGIYNKTYRHSTNGDRYISGYYGSSTGLYDFRTYCRNSDYDFAYVVIADCTHVFKTTCGSCSICGEAQANAQHSYANDCDETCEGCGETRVAPHAYASECDTTCTCGATRETNASHEAEYACLGTCKNCGETFTPVASHVYDGCTDTDCNNGCGTTREAGEHDFDACSTKCNNCTETREAAEADHTDGDDEDILCDLCGKVELGGADTPDQDVTVD